MLELKSCPFCGQSVAEVDTIAGHEMMDEGHPDYQFASTHYDVVCNYLKGGCGASCGGSHLTPEAAVNAWNRRN